MNEKKKMDEVFKLLDQKVVKYLLDNNINEAEEADIVDIMTEYKQLVRDGIFHSSIHRGHSEML